MTGRQQGRAAFTLVELLVGSALIMLLLVVMLGIVNQTASTWRYSSSKSEQFRGARNAFESVTRRLSQATLNTYWDYEYSGSGSNQIPKRYVRQSDLRFLSGSAEAIIPEKGNKRLGHAVFFQAPLGYAEEAVFNGLPNLLNTWGYFIEFASDEALRPEFLNNVSPALAPKYRFRIMEMMDPSEKLSIYSLTSGVPNYNQRDWFTKALDRPVRPVHVLAENVIALVLLPKLSPEEDVTGTALAPAYTYDSTVTHPDPKLNPKHQLPPLVQVTVVAIDEISAARIANGESMPELGVKELFQTAKPNSAANFAEDLKVLQESLGTRGISYRVFTTQVSIRAAKWSRD